MNANILIHEALDTPFALMPTYLSVVGAILSRWRDGHDADRDDFANLQARSGSRSASRSGPNAAGIQVIPMHGVLSQRGDILDAILGGGSVSTQAVSQALRAALADDSVAGVILDIDSPGGSVYHIGELSDEVYRARSVKPIFAIADALAGSAAYWIGASATQFYSTPSGEVGSIGVFALHSDLSAAFEREGIKTTLIAAGKYKTEGNAFEPLGAEARNAVQGRIDEYYGAFTRAVARGRNTTVDAVRNGMGQGRIVGAPKAAAQNMIDGVATFDQTVAALGKVLHDGKTPAARLALASKSPFAASEQARLRYEARLRDLDLSA